MREKIFVIVICTIVAVLISGAIIYTFQDGGFHKKTYEGHTYIFYGDKPVEHDVECKKCAGLFDKIYNKGEK